MIRFSSEHAEKGKKIFTSLREGKKFDPFDLVLAVLAANSGIIQWKPDIVPS